MATKLTRLTLQQFGSTVNPASEVGEFGSGVSSPVYTGSITLMQSLAAWNRGWAAETIANNRPFLEDMNAVDCVFGYNLCYLMQAGIAEYDSGTIYFLNSIAQQSGTVYQVINDNGATGISGTVPTNGTYWKVFTQYSAELQTWATKSIGTIFQAPTDLFIITYALLAPTSGAINIYTDSSATPSTNRAEVTNPSAGSVQDTLSCMVKKNDYYQVVQANCSGGFLYVISIGT